MKNVLILGSTGSIGKSTLEVIDNNDNFNVVSLVAKNQKDLLLEQAYKFNASNVYLSNESFSSAEQSKHLNLNLFNCPWTLLIAGKACKNGFSTPISLAFSAKALLTSVDIAKGLNLSASIVLKSMFERRSVTV